MQKRVYGKKEDKLEAEESQFVIGATVSYYLEGTRYAKVSDTDIDDDGDLTVRIIPISGSKKEIWLKLKDVNLVK